uniref:Protein kinase domain-containing protein n=2 Tax=Clytia hemisphaerica TaxID=252671 RepID=A0A7M5UUT5_9CNID
MENSEASKDQDQNVQSKIIHKKRKKRHKRSEAGKKKQNAKTKVRQKVSKAKFKAKLELGKKNDTITKLQERLMKFCRKTLPNLSSVRTKTVIATNVKSHINTTNSRDFIIRKLEGIPKVNPNDFDFIDYNVGSGVFGSVKLGRIKTLNSTIAAKVLDEKTSSKSLLAEVVTLLTLSGSQYFPFCYGLLDDTDKPKEPLNKCILMEFLGQVNGDMYSPYPTLAKMASSRLLNHTNIRHIFSLILEGVQFLHLKGILHNDIKADNIVVCKERVVLIDFGKATMIKCPVTYNIKKADQVTYNLYHRHLAHELRNKTNSKQTKLTDIYSIGYMFKHVAATLPYKPLIELGRHMKVPEPSQRLSIESALIVLS